MSNSGDSPLSSAPSDIELEKAALPVSALKAGQKRSRAIKQEAQSKQTASKRRKITVIKSEEGNNVQSREKVIAPTKASPRKKKVKVEAKEILTVVTDKLSDKRPEKSGKKVIRETVKTEENIEVQGRGAVTAKRKRKTKEQREAEAMPLAARTLGSKVLVGAHVSSAGGVHNAVMNSVHIGGNAFALFLKSQRKWENPPLQDEQLTGFMSGCKEHKYGSHDHTIPPIVPHGSYLVNLAHPDPARTKQAYDAFLDDLQRCSRLGIRLYNFHPGSCGASESRSHAISHLAKQLNKAHKDPSSGNVITLLETMTSSTNILGATFEDLAEAIDQIEDKTRVGVCLDTCHIFAAGYDLRTPDVFQQTINHFDKVIGLKYLRALHMNDSKAPLNSGRDLHANIGTGFLGLRAFHNIMNESRLWGLPMILETPIDVKDSETGKDVPDKRIWATEIKLLESLVGMDAESTDFKKLESELRDKGEAERDRIQAQVDKKLIKTKEKAEKAKTKATRGTKKKSKKVAESSDDSDMSD